MEAPSRAAATVQVSVTPRLEPDVTPNVTVALPVSRLAAGLIVAVSCWVVPTVPLEDGGDTPVTLKAAAEAACMPAGTTRW